MVSEKPEWTEDGWTNVHATTAALLTESSRAKTEGERKGNGKKERKKERKKEETEGG